MCCCRNGLLWRDELTSILTFYNVLIFFIRSASKEFSDFSSYVWERPPWRYWLTAPWGCCIACRRSRRNSWAHKGARRTDKFYPNNAAMPNFTSDGFRFKFSSTEMLSEKFKELFKCLSVPSRKRAKEFNKKIRKPMVEKR